jgi:vancomycin resistance protein YoaR
MKSYTLAVLPVALVVLLLGSVLAFEFYYAEAIYPGVRVWGTDVGGWRAERAMADLADAVGLDEPLVTLRGPHRSWQVRPFDLGLGIDVEATLEAAYRRGRGESRVGDLVSHLGLLIRGEDVAPVLVYDAPVTRAYLQTLAEQIDTPPSEVQLTFDGLTPVVAPAQPGRQLDVEATLEALAPALKRLEPVEVALVVHNLHPTVADAEPARTKAEALLSGPLTLVLSDPREGDPGPWVLSPEQLVTMLEIYAEGGALHARLSADALRGLLQKWAPALAIEPVNARYRFNDATGELEPIEPSQEGRTLDVEASVARIVAAADAGERHIPLVMKAVPASYPDTATAEDVGIVELVATGESYFIGSPSGRDHNIRLAASIFDGVVIPPGETFSFNHYLGEVSAEEGYEESYVTAGEQLAVEPGGGICQVSTTAFRAAFWGGYPIDERWAHSQRVGYYELRGGGVGMDATVYAPRVDFKFTNDRAFPLLIETEVNDASHRLVFRFYSTDDGREVEMEGPEVTDETEPGPPIYELDEDLAPGTVTKWQSAVDGLTATVERRVYDEEGQLVYEDAFVSTYEPRRAAYHYGPGYELPAEEKAASE